MEIPGVQLRKENTYFGTLYVGEYDWAGEVKDGEWVTRPPYLKDGGKVPSNQTVWGMFGLKVYGDCYLRLLPDRIEEMNTARMTGKRDIAWRTIGKS